MSKYFIMVTDHRMLVAEADSYEEIMKIYDDLSEYEGYKNKMKILMVFGSDGNIEMEGIGKYPFPDLDNLIDEEETHS